MGNDLLGSLRRLSDAELVARVKELAARERGATVLLVAHLAELDTRDFHLRAGHGSLFGYCREVLALSEQEAYNRIAVARSARRFPVVLEMLEAGALNLTTVRLLAPRLTPDNHRAVLESARGKSKLQVEEIAARLWPQPDVPSFVRKLPAPRPVVTPAATAAADVAVLAAGSSSLTSPSPIGLPPSDSPLIPPQVSSRLSADVVAPPTAAPDAPPVQQPPIDAPGRITPALSALPSPPTRPSAEVTPLSPDRYRVQVTIGGDTLEKLRFAKDLLRHAVPSGDEATILDRALTALLTDLAQQKFAATERPRSSTGATPGSRHIPAEVKRAVWLRDLGRCAFVGTAGRRCAERGFLEFHHRHPHALGGPATVANIQLRCRAHNEYESRVDFGRDGRGLVREGAVRYGARAPELVPERVRRSRIRCAKKRRAPRPAPRAEIHAQPRAALPTRHLPVSSFAPIGRSCSEAPPPAQRAPAAHRHRRSG